MPCNNSAHHMARTDDAGRLRPRDPAAAEASARDATGRDPQIITGGGQEPPPGHCDRMCFIPRALTVPSRHGPKQPPGPTLIIVLTGDNHFFIFTSWGIKSHSSCFFKIIIYEQQQLLLCIHPGPLKVGPSLRAQVRTAPPWHTSGRVTHYLIM